MKEPSKHGRRGTLALKLWGESMRTQKEIDKLIRDNDLFYPDDNDEEFTNSQCWGVRVDKENNKILFSIDNKEVLSHSLSKIKFALSREKLSELLKLFKIGDLKVVKKALTK